MCNWYNIISDMFVVIDKTFVQRFYLKTIDVETSFLHFELAFLYRYFSLNNIHFRLDFILAI